MVRLRYGFIIRCDEAIYDETGGLTHLNCTYFRESRSGQDKSGLKASGVIHWVDANSCELVSVRQYGRLFDVPMPKSADFVDHIDKNSLVESQGLLEKAVMEKDIERIQFERIGYFYRDPDLPRTYNKTVSLREGF
jgi:glutaminyl-tRNA synthetase